MKPSLIRSYADFVNTSIPSVDIETEFALSPNQRRWGGNYLWDPATGQELWIPHKSWSEVQVPIVLPDEGVLERLRDALRLLCFRHDALRTVFPIRHLRGRVQRVLDAPCFEIYVNEPVNFSSFNIETGPLLGAALYARAVDGRGLAILSCHHLLIDGQSGRNLTRELLDLYSALANNERLGIIPKLNYQNFSNWYNRIEKESPLIEFSRDYWKTELHDAPMFRLPLTSDVLENDSQCAHFSQFAIRSSEYAPLARLARTQGVSLMDVLYAAYFIALNLTTKLEDIIIGTPLPGREHPELADAIGLYINQIPLRNKLFKELQFKELLHSVSTKLARAREAQLSQLDNTANDVGLLHSRDGFPFTNTFFNPIFVPSGSGYVTAPNPLVMSIDAATGQIMEPKATKQECRFHLMLLVMISRDTMTINAVYKYQVMAHQASTLLSIFRNTLAKIAVHGLGVRVADME